MARYSGGQQPIRQRHSNVREEEVYTSMQDTELAQREGNTLTASTRRREVMRDGWKQSRRSQEGNTGVYLDREERRVMPSNTEDNDRITETNN